VLIGVIIPTLNAAADWQRLLPTLLASVAPESVLIVDSSSADHAADNAGAARLALSADDIAVLDKSFPRGPKPRHLPML